MTLETNTSCLPTFEAVTLGRLRRRSKGVGRQLPIQSAVTDLASLD